MSRRSEILAAKKRKRHHRGHDHFIQGIFERPGAKGGLHRSLGVPMGQKIPVSQIRAHEHDPGKVGKQARLAMALRGMH